MSGQAVRWARAQKIESGALKNMLNSLASRCDPGGATTASQATLAADMSMSVRHVKRLLGTLERLRMISREKRSRGALGRTSDRIVLAMGESFTVSKATIGDAMPARKGTQNAFARGQAPHLAEKSQGDTRVLRITYTPNSGPARGERCQSGQGEGASREGAKLGTAFALVEWVAPTPEPRPSGRDMARRSLVGSAGRHSASTSRHGLSRSMGGWRVAS